MDVQIIDASGRAVEQRERYGCTRLRWCRVGLASGASRAVFQEEEGREEGGGEGGEAAHSVSHAQLAALASGMADASGLFRRALRLSPAAVECDVLVEPRNGRQRLVADGAAHGFGEIRLAIGSHAPEGDVRRIARHEALHLLLAQAMPRDPHLRWDARDDTFVDCIIRGIESCDEPEAVPPLPERLAEMPPKGREWKQWAVSCREAAPSFFEQLEARLMAWAAPLGAYSEDAREAFVEHKRTWALETAFGQRWLREARRAARSDDAPLDWLIDDRRHHFHLYASGGIARYKPATSVAELPDGALDWTVKLSVLAQALQCADDRTFDASLCGDVCRHAVLEQLAAAPRKDRARLYLARRGSSGRAPPPIRELAHRAPPAAREVVRRSLAGLPETAEARTIWARIAARLLAEHPFDLAALAPGSVPPRARVVVIGDGAMPWQKARRLLAESFANRRICEWVPEVETAHLLEHVSTGPQSVLLVFGCVPTPALLSRVRALAARANIRGALFHSLENGAAHERTRDQPAPRDPRYREGAWAAGERAHADIVGAIDEETSGGYLVTPLGHLLSMTSFGVEEVILEPFAKVAP